MSNLSCREPDFCFGHQGRMMLWERKRNNNMSASFLDVFIIAVLIISIGMIVTGNGESLFKMFGGKQSNGFEKYEEGAMLKATLIFCIILLANEVCTIFLGDKIPYMPFISIGVTALDFAVFILYLRKHKK